MLVKRNAAAFTGIALRSILFGFGAATVVWVLYTYPIFWGQSGLKQTAEHIIAGEPFKPAILNAMSGSLVTATTSEWDRPSTLGKAAVIRLRLLEQAIADGDQKAIDEQMARLRTVVRQSLVNTPADPLLWLVLFWLENAQNGFDPTHLRYLRMSYVTGPNEGWIGVRRNRLALAVFRELSPDLAEVAMNEFVRLVDSQFIAEAADILVGPGWPIRNKLLPRLKGVEVVNRERFAKTVYRLGYDIVVPGVEPRGQRPWD